jgi:protein subunit release factor A
MVTVTRGRSQHHNRAAALGELTARLQHARDVDSEAIRDRLRADQVSAGTRHAGAHLRPTGAAVAKTFTYNAQRGEVVEHATGARWRLDRFMRGHLDDPVC